MKKTALILVLAFAFVAFVNAQSKTEIQKTDLPKAITQNITQDFNGFMIEKAFKVNTANNQFSYEVVVAKGNEKERLDYSSSGAFIKKEPIQHMTAQKQPDKQSQTQSQTKKN